VTPTPAATSLAVERVAAEYVLTRYSGPGNPMQTETLIEGELVATKVSYARDNSQMNAVHGLNRAEALPRVLEFYAATSQPCWVDVTPATPTAVTDALCHAGFRPVNYVAALLADPIPEPLAPAEDVDVDAAIAREDLDVFLDTINAGFGVPSSMLATLRRNQSFWWDVQSWHLFHARIGGRSAAAAVLSIHGDTGYLAAAATLPEFRSRGAHTTLIAARIAAARALGCARISGQAASGSASQCNQQRAGLGIVHTKTIWTNRQPSAEAHSR
jgi:GNAT superfamily N-acetyltransferase